MAGVTCRFSAAALAVGCVFATALTTTAGCASKPKDGNPSFPVSIEQARKDLERIARDPRSPGRPIVILGGFADPGVGGVAVGSQLRRYLGPDAKIVCVSFTFCNSFESCRQRV